MSATSTCCSQELKTKLLGLVTPRFLQLILAGQCLLSYALQRARLLDDVRPALLENGTSQGSLMIGSLDTTTALRPAPLLTGLPHPTRRSL